MVNLKSKNISVLIIEIENDNPQEILEDLREKLSSKFFSKTNSMPFLIKAKKEVSPQTVEKIEQFLKEKGFVPVLNTTQKEEKKEIHNELSVSLEKLPTNNVKVINKSLRAGQSVEHTGDVLILGDVNPGAEVKATGNIIVMGTLKGVAWAGYLGNPDAVIVALRMQPSQLRIANIIAINEDEENRAPDYPEIAKIENGEVVIKRLV